MAILVGGISLTTGSWFFLATGVAVFGLLVVRTKKEEEKLVERFGNEYRPIHAIDAAFSALGYRSPNNMNDDHAPKP
jgi:hypothetical protein